MHGTLAEATSSSIAGTGLYIRKKSSNRLPSLVGIQFPGFGVLDKWMVQLPSVFFARWPSYTNTGSADSG